MSLLNALEHNIAVAVYIVNNSVCIHFYNTFIDALILRFQAYVFYITLIWMFNWPHIKQWSFASVGQNNGNTCYIKHTPL